MADETHQPLPTGVEDPKAKLALGLGIGSVLVFVVLAVLDHDGAGWVLQPVLGIAAMVTGWMSAKGMPRSGKALIGFVLGAAMTLLFLGWIIFGGD
jgi:hypothetical protein